MLAQGDLASRQVGFAVRRPAGLFDRALHSPAYREDEETARDVDSAVAGAPLGLQVETPREKPERHRGVFEIVFFLPLVLFFVCVFFTEKEK